MSGGGAKPWGLRPRPPDFVIGGQVNPYVWRWYLIPQNRFFNIYLHKMWRDDDPRALHDHPWWNVSVVLYGGYIEVTPAWEWAPSPHTRVADLPRVGRRRRPGAVIFRRATAPHLLAFPANHHPGVSWSLFITGRKFRKWGFHCKQGFVPWDEFVSMDDTGSIGPGCGDDQV